MVVVVPHTLALTECPHSHLNHATQAHPTQDSAIATLFAELVRRTAATPLTTLTTPRYPEHGYLFDTARRQRLAAHP